MTHHADIRAEAPSPGRELVVFEHANLGYGKLTVLADLNLVLASGDYLGIVGPNGAGKTTILKAMLGILRPLSGRVRRDASVRFGYVPQRQYVDETYPLTVMEVALMGRYSLPRGLRTAETEGQRVRARMPRSRRHRRPRR